MVKPLLRISAYFFSIVIIFFSACSDNGISEVEVILTMDEKVANEIKVDLNKMDFGSGKIDDSTRVQFPDEVNSFYTSHQFIPFWSSSENWLPLADSLYQFIKNAENEGLFKDDYHSFQINKLKHLLDADSLNRLNPVLWSKADLLLTDGMMQLIKDLKLGRLKSDSVSLNIDTVLTEKYLVNAFNQLKQKNNFSAFITSLQPTLAPYWELKKGVKNFVEKMDRRVYTFVKYPYTKGNTGDSILFIKQLQQRLVESNCLEYSYSLPDSTKLYQALKKFQSQNGLKDDGAIGQNTVNKMNDNDVEKFSRIVLTLDKYKQLPRYMPDKYIWVNLPGYYLWMIEKDTIRFESKVIIGKPVTRTPLLNAKISDMLTYPTWTVPNSIIVKDYLPKLKKNAGYISKIGLHLVNSEGDEVDPNTVNWSKYSRGIPYKVVQASGDNNSLGVIKFNFYNPYFVYLHDTNQRYLFKNETRALSHGCVRVKEWEKLAYYIAQNDSMMNAEKNVLKYTADSIKNWIAKKQRQKIVIKNPIPLFIRYYTCEGLNGNIVFYNDVYAEDKNLLQRYYAKK